MKKLALWTGWSFVAIAAILVAISFFVVALWTIVIMTLLFGFAMLLLTPSFVDDPKHNKRSF